jgi:hypothetical protein
MDTCEAELVTGAEMSPPAEAKSSINQLFSATNVTGENERMVSYRGNTSDNERHKRIHGEGSVRSSDERLFSAINIIQE